MLASLLTLNTGSSSNLLLIISLVALLLVVVSLVLMYFRQERINNELRLRIGDIEWLQLSEYHKNFKPINLNKPTTKQSFGSNNANETVVKDDSLEKDVANLEKDIEEMDKILEDTIDTTEEDGISQMILQMINKHEDNTVLDDNLENVISTASNNNTNDSDILDKDIDMNKIEATILSSIENNDNLSDDTNSNVDMNNVSSLPDTEWIEESYTMNELRDLCKNNNIQAKGTKKQVIKTLLEKNVEIPKKTTQSYLSK
jgi:hypothetical protein